jgi:hypothetical protein
MDLDVRPNRPQADRSGEAANAGSDDDDSQR